MFPTVISTVTGADVAPRASRTVREAVKLPVELYWCWVVGVEVDELWPSPKVQSHVSASPSGSELPLPSKFTINGELPLVGLAVIEAVGTPLAAVK